MTDAKPRRTPKEATAAAISAEPVVEAEAAQGEPVAAAVASGAPATKKPPARKKAAPVAADATEGAKAAPVAKKPATRKKAVPVPADGIAEPSTAEAAPVAKKPATRKKAAAPAVGIAEPATAKAAPAAKKPPARKKAVAADASAPASGGRRPGLPLREPGQARKRPTRKATDSVGDGSIDPGEPDAFALAMARRIVDAAEDKKASDIVLLDVRALTAVTDYFIICSGMSERQLGAIADGIAETLKAEQHVLPLGREGGANAHWVLLDFGAAIVHVMATPEREFYQLEKLWADAKVLLHVL